MKKLLMGTMILPLFVGCASVKYTKLDNEETFKYTRFGNQKIAGFKASKGEDGTMQVELEGQESDMSQAMEAVKNATELLKRGAGIP